MTSHCFTNATIATAASPSAAGKPEYGLLPDAALVITNGTISWIGASSEIPDSYIHTPHTDLHGKLITPGLIDCHTHLVYAGNRANEFEQRLEGVSYQDIAKAGGGIISTVNATRAASETELLRETLPRVDSLISDGVTTVEIKSGYGLDKETELKMLRVARMIPQHRNLRVVTTFLGAHAIPPEYRDRADDYIDEVCIPTLIAANDEGLVDMVDGFCENIAFSPAQIRRVFEQAKALDLPVKLHAEQLSDQQGVVLATQYSAKSVEHLEYLSPNDVPLMHAPGTVATLAPGAFYYLRETQLPPIDAFREHGIPMAVSTDANPGSSPIFSLLTAMNMACTLFRLTPAEAFAGVTRHAAVALSQHDCGVLAPGKRADFAIWHATNPADLVYPIGHQPLYQRWFGGKLTLDKPRPRAKELKF